MFPREWIDDLQRDSLEFDCGEITLTQEDSASPTVFRGPGYVRQEAGGGIGFKVFPVEVKNRSPFQLGLEDATAGKILEARHYYGFHATDCSGDTWSGHRVLPDVHTSLRSLTDVTHVVTGSLLELRRERPQIYPAEGARLLLHFFGEFDIPGNIGTRRTITVGGEVVESVGTLDRARFAAFGLDFDVHFSAGRLTVRVDSALPLRPHLELRIVEALRFMLARPLSWSALELAEGGVETIRIRPKPACPVTRLHAPVGRGSHERHTCTWPLFIKYLAFALGNDKPTVHPCSAQLFAVLTASSLSIDAMGLALGVAVESLTKCLYAGVGEPPAGLREAVKELESHVAAWQSDLASPEAIDRLKKRVGGMLGYLPRPSPKDRLHALAARGVVDKRHIKVWERLRNPTAHGDPADATPRQDFVDQCNAVTVLLYHLIFGAIGYEGRYTDYGTHHYPPRFYRGRPVTHEDIAVAAYYRWQARGEEPGGELDDWLQSERMLREGHE